MYTVRLYYCKYSFKVLWRELLLIILSMNDSYLHCLSKLLAWCCTYFSNTFNSCNASRLKGGGETNFQQLQLYSFYCSIRLPCLGKPQLQRTFSFLVFPSSFSFSISVVIFQSGTFQLRSRLHQLIIEKRLRNSKNSCCITLTFMRDFTISFEQVQFFTHSELSHLFIKLIFTYTTYNNEVSIQTDSQCNRGLLLDARASLNRTVCSFLSQRIVTHAVLRTFPFFSSYSKRNFHVWIQ